MRKLWLGLSILGVLLILCIGELSILNRQNCQITALLEQAFHADMEEAETISLRAKQCWEKSVSFIDTVMSHEETDEIRREFSDLLIFAREKSREDYLASCGRLLVMIQHLTEMERPLWQNIL